MTRNAQSSVSTIDDFITSVGISKVAADPISEPGSKGGETSHPVKSVDDRLTKAKEGERSAENTKDVKEDQGKPSVENAPEAKTASAASIFQVASRFAKKADGDAVSKPGSAEDDQLQIGTKKAPTGEDKSVETASAKAGKEDPGSSHPARTDNDSLDGHKYAADAPLEKLAMAMRDIGNDICAQVHYLSNQQGSTATAEKAAAAQTDNRPATAPRGSQAPALDPNLAKQAGWELAGLINGTHDKQAVDRMVNEALYGVVKTASEDADRFIAYSREYFTKLAEGEEAPESEAGGGSGPAPGGGGGGAPPPGGGGEEEAILAGLGGGEPGMEGGGGEPGGDQAVQQLAQILEQLGVTPEELQQAMEAGGMGGGGMGGPPGGGMGGPPPDAGGGMPPPPGGGGMPPMGGGGGAPPPGMEAMASAGSHKTAAVDKSAVANYVREVVARSRTRK